MSAFGFNVFDFGARGDGKTDDTAAVQRAIDFCAARGGGRICFPYTPNGYRIASPGREAYQGRPLRAQLVIPPGAHNILLEGEMPCRMLHEYAVRPMAQGVFSPTVFGSMVNCNTFLFSDWQAPQVHEAGKRPWAILAAPEGESQMGRDSVAGLSLKNLEFRVPMPQGQMYPTESALNLQNVTCVQIADCLIGLGEVIGDALQDKELQPNPCHTAGIVLPASVRGEAYLQCVTVQGYRYGVVAGNCTTASDLALYNCEEGVTFHRSQTPSAIHHLRAHHVRMILTTARTDLFGMPRGTCHVTVGSLSFEDGLGARPQVSALYAAVFDPEDRLHGDLHWCCTDADSVFPVKGAKHFSVQPLS